VIAVFDNGLHDVVLIQNHWFKEQRRNVILPLLILSLASTFSPLASFIAESTALNASGSMGL
jgi:hypothetical protein